MMRTKVALLVLGVALVLARAGVARADGRVVVLEVDGDKERRFEKALTAMVKRDHEIVTRRSFDRAASRAGLEDRDAKSIGTVADKLAVDVVVDAALEREGRVYTLTIRVRGADGKTAKKLTVELAKPRLSTKAKSRLGRRLRKSVNEVAKRQDEAEDVQIAESDGDDEAAEPIDPSDDESPAARKAARAKRDGEPKDDGAAAAAVAATSPAPTPEVAAPAKPAPAPPADATRVAAADVGAGGEGLDRENPLPAARPAADATVAAKAMRREPSRPTAVRLEVGGAATTRNLSFQTRENFGAAPPGYTGPPTPGVHVAGEVYPLALASSGFFSGLGIAAEYNQSLLLTTRSADAMDEALPTTQAQWSVGARFRLRFGRSATAPSLTVGGGYGRRSFTVDRSALPANAVLDLPDVDYAYVDPGLTFRLPLGRRVALFAGGKALLLLSAGDIQEQDQYGAATATGGEAIAGIDVMITSRFLINVTGTGALIGLDFEGNGDQINNRDQDPDTEDIAGATDTYLGGSASLGVIF
jgi:hypothetical protein